MRRSQPHVLLSLVFLAGVSSCAWAQESVPGCYDLPDDPKLASRFEANRVRWTAEIAKELGLVMPVDIIGWTTYWDGGSITAVAVDANGDSLRFARPALIRFFEPGTHIVAAHIGLYLNCRYWRDPASVRVAVGSAKYRAFVAMLCLCANALIPPSDQMTAFASGGDVGRFYWRTVRTKDLDGAQRVAFDVLSLAGLLDQLDRCHDGRP